MGWMAASFTGNTTWVAIPALLLMSLPSVTAFVRWVGWTRGGAALIALSLFAFLVESAAVYTGFPYGAFTYGTGLGPRVFGLVPWVVPLGWIPLILGAVPLASRMASGFAWRVAWAGIFVMLMDVVLDPGAVRMGLWTFVEGGGVHGVPIQNFVGWVMTGVLGSGIVQAFSRFTTTPTPAALCISAALSMGFWFGYALGASLWVSIVVGCVMLAGMGWIVWSERK